MPSLRLACVVVVLGACDLDVDYGGTAFRCEAACPSGQACVDGICRLPGEITDGGPDDADAGASAYALAVLEDDPILYLRLDEPANAIAAIDASGEGRDGAYLGGAVSGEPGAFPGSGTSVHFDGLDDRVVVQDDEALRLNGDFSIELWVRLDEHVNEYPGVISKGGSAGDNSYILYYSPTNDPIYKRANESRGAVTAPFPPDRFRYYVLTYQADAGLLTWYVDGIYNSDQLVTYPLNAHEADLSIGRADDYGRQWLDEVAFYATALSEERVAAHHDAATASLRR